MIIKRAIQFSQILVDRVIQHESYKKSPWQTSNDIALVRLDTPAKLAPNVIPVCLPIKRDQVQVCARRFCICLIVNTIHFFPFPFWLQSDLAYLWEVPNLLEGIKDMRKNVTVAGYGRTSSDKYDLGELNKVGITTLIKFSYRIRNPAHMTWMRNSRSLLLNAEKLAIFAPGRPC